MTEKLEIRKISELIPYANNARVHSPAQIELLRRSLREFGFVSPVLIDGAGNVIAGHGRIEAAKAEGIEDAPCVLVEHLTDSQRRAYILADNRLAELSSWDDVARDAELLRLRGEGVDLTLTGFDDGEISVGETSEANPVDAHEDDFDEDPPETPFTCPGQLWQLGRHRLICGDSTDAAVIDRLMDGAFARMTVTSPPYGVGQDYEQKGIEPWRKTIGGVINAIKGKTLIVCWNIGDLFSTGTQFIEPTGSYSIQMFDTAGYGMLYSRIWKKPGANFAGNNPYYTVTTKPAQDYEYLYAFAEKDFEKHLDDLKKYLFAQAKKASITDNIVKSVGGPAFMCGHWFTNHQWALIDEKNYQLLQTYCREHGIDAFQREYFEIKREYLKNTIFSHSLSDKDFSEWGLYGVWEFNTVHKRLGGHAAAFPVELPTRFIKMHSYEEDIVLDPFGGTGTTLIACEQLNRKCYMCELSPKYVDVIIGRWEALTGEKAVLLNG